MPREEISGSRIRAGRRFDLLRCAALVAVMAGAAACPTPARRPLPARLPLALPGVSTERRPAGPTCLIQGIAPPERLAVDGRQLFWINGRGEVQAIAKAGGPPRRLASGQLDLHDLALDAASVYWLAHDAVRSVAKGGGQVQTIAPTGPGPHESYFEDVVVVGKTVLWTAPLVHQVMLRDPQHGKVVTAAFIRQPQPGHLVADEASLYVWRTGTVARIDRASGTAQTVISAPDRVTQLRVDGPDLFWSEHPGGRLMSSTAGGDPRVLASGQRSISGLAIDADSVYWTDLDAGKVLMVSRQGGAVALLASGQPGPGDLVLDDQYLYWSNSGGKTGARGALMRLRKVAGRPRRGPQSRPAGAAAAPRPPAPVSATLQLTRPLCIKIGARPELVGGVRVELRNLTANKVRLYSEDHNSLVFESVKDGSLHVAAHECACVQNTGPDGFWRELGANETQVKTFDDWTHDGGPFPTMPPGEYRLSFRFFLRPRPHLGPGQPRLEVCRAELQSPAYWSGALSSNAMQVRVGWGRCSARRR